MESTVIGSLLAALISLLHTALYQFQPEFMISVDIIYSLYIMHCGLHLLQATLLLSKVGYTVSYTVALIASSSNMLSLLTFLLLALAIRYVLGIDQSIILGMLFDQFVILYHSQKWLCY